MRTKRRHRSNQTITCFLFLKPPEGHPSRAFFFSQSKFPIHHPRHEKLPH
jgi:hypothetical protein